jgi:tripartite-type tricarboxylate transporter receptor subunit TctC
MIFSRSAGSLRTAYFAAAVAVVLPGAALAQSSDYPTQPVIFVAPGTLGGGSDVQARIAANIATESGIFGSQPVAVLNKGGGGSQEAFTFLLQHRDNPHYLLTFQASLITYVLLGEAQYELEDFTPLANVAIDPVIMVTRADSEFKTLDDVIKAAQASPDTITMGGGGVAGPDRMGLLRLQEAADFTVRYVPFAGGGEIHRNVLGGHVQVAVGNPSDFMASIEAGELIGLALLDEERSTVPALANVPTAKEQGYDVSFATFRGWFMPGEVDPEVKKTLEGIFKQVTEHPDFKEKYADRYGMRVAYMDSEEFSKYIDDRVVEFRELLTKAGVIQ